MQTTSKLVIHIRLSLQKEEKWWVIQNYTILQSTTKIPSPVLVRHLRCERVCQRPTAPPWLLGFQWFSDELGSEASGTKWDWSVPTGARRGDGEQAPFSWSTFKLNGVHLLAGRQWARFSPSLCRNLWRPPKESLTPLRCCSCGSRPQCKMTAACLWSRGQPLKQMSDIWPAVGNVSPKDLGLGSEKMNGHVSTQQMWKSGSHQAIKHLSPGLWPQSV